MTTIEDLVGDPAFQLNAFLWLCQPMPAGSVSSALHRLGFRVVSIGPSLPLPPPLAKRIREEKLPLNKSCSPEIVLEHRERVQFTLIECKASSFPPVLKDQGKQAATMLVALSHGHASDNIGLSASYEGATTFAVRCHDVERLRSSLDNIVEQLAQLELSCDPPLLIGFLVNGTHVGLALNEEAARWYGTTESVLWFLTPEDAQDDPRPLYFVPFDPDAGADDYGRALLKERILQFVLMRTGSAGHNPFVEFSADDALNHATFGLFKKYDSRNGRKHLRGHVHNAIGQVMKHLATRSLSGLTYIKKSQRWKFTFESRRHHDEIMKVLAKLNRVTLSDPDEKGSLFKPEDW